MRESVGVEVDIVQRRDIVTIEYEIIASFVVDVEGTSWFWLREKFHDGGFDCERQRTSSL